MNLHSDNIAQVIRGKNNPVKAEWLENYVKHNIKSLGVGIPELRRIIKDHERDSGITEEPVAFQIEILDELMHSEYTENKLAAILYIELFWKGRSEKMITDLVSGWFDNKWISDWNVCDWLCVKILSPIIDEDPVITRELEAWNHDRYLWKARASLVPFAQCKTIGNHVQTIYKFAANLIKREERFCKTAVGWVLREYSKKDPGFVNDFLADHYGWTTPEVIRNATRYLDRK